MTSIDIPAAQPECADAALAASQSAEREWSETVLIVLFTASAILFVSFLAVVTGLV
jgi:hypothetical protein